MKQAVGDVVIPLVSFLAGIVLLGGGAWLALSTLGNTAEPVTKQTDGERSVVGPVTCDAPIEDVPSLPLGAEPEAMLICADLSNKQPWTAPADLVEGDLSALTEALADLEPAPLDDYACTMVGGPAYDLVLRLAGNSYATIHGDNGGCGVVTVGSVDYFGAPKVLDAALALVEEQRSRTDPPDEVPSVDLSCDTFFTEHGGPMSYTGEPRDLVRLVSCWQPNAPELGPGSQTDVLPADVRLLARDIDRRAEEGDPRDLRCPGGMRHHYFQHLIGETSWGDVVLVLGECRRFIVSDPRGGADTIVWRPSPQAQRLLDQLRR